VYKESWPQTFAHREATSTVDNYLQSLLAHWYHRQLVRRPPLPPFGLTAHEISRFLNGLKLTNSLKPIELPKDRCGSLDIFIANPVATTEAYALVSGQAIAHIWRKVLPSPEILTLDLNENDKCFVAEVAFQYTNLRTAAKSIKFRHKQGPLSDVLATWHSNLSKDDPPLDEVIFLCEKFRIFDKETRERKVEYEGLKSKYQSREAV